MELTSLRRLCPNSNEIVNEISLEMLETLETARRDCVEHRIVDRSRRKLSGKKIFGAFYKKKNSRFWPVKSVSHWARHWSVFELVCKGKSLERSNDSLKCMGADWRCMGFFDKRPLTATRYIFGMRTS